MTMTRRMALALGGMALLGAVGAAADEPATAACRNKPAKSVAARQAKLRCALTGTEVDRCCCVERDGKLHCTLAKRDIEKCCCSEVKPKDAAEKR
jgi:hypothetical protein